MPVQQLTQEVDAIAIALLVIADGPHVGSTGSTNPAKPCQGFCRCGCGVDTGAESITFWAP